MEVTWLDRNQPAPRDVAAAVSLLEAARQVDAPDDLSPTVSHYSAHVRCGWDGDPPAVALARDEHDTAVAVLETHLPTWDNRHLGFVMVTVDPLRRRQGIGRHMFELGVGRVKAARRTLLCSECLDGPAVAFLEKYGLERASTDVWRRQNLRALDRASIEADYNEARTAAADYDLVRIPVPTPGALLEDVVQITQAINDAPTDDLDIEDEVFSPERIRAFEAAQAAQGRRVYRLAARPRGASGLAGHTLLAVEADRPWHAWQYDTSVLAEHRGHRLGLLLKTAMLRWMEEDEPQIRTVDTWNAASNEHMIAVNDALGYQVVSRGFTWQRRL
jgi:GNAT superfamily N-acetyltransferase